MIVTILNLSGWHFISFLSHTAGLYARSLHSFHCDRTGTFASVNFCSLELSLPGAKVTWNFCYQKRKCRENCSKIAVRVNIIIMCKSLRSTCSGSSLLNWQLYTWAGITRVHSKAGRVYRFWLPDPSQPIERNLYPCHGTCTRRYGYISSWLTSQLWPASCSSAFQSFKDQQQTNTEIPTV